MPPEHTNVDAPEERKPLLQTKDITFSIEGNVILDKVTFDLHSGETHILFGENGAGKTTFIKILCGRYRPHHGTILLDGREVSISSPSHSRSLGIVAVHQDFSLVPQLSVLENLYLGREFSRGVFLDNKTMVKEAKDYIESLNLGFDLNLNDKIRNLSMVKQQIIAIVRALLQSVKVLVLDEPTSNFSDKETEMLFAHINELKGKGIGIIYISHVIEELKTIGNRVTILRDGKVVGHIDSNAEITRDNLLKGMISGKSKRTFPELNVGLGSTTLEVTNLSTASGLSGVNFNLRRGEILGIGGLPDSGKSLLGRTLIGLEQITSGEIKIKGKDIARKLTPSKALRNDMIYFPAEKFEGLVLCRSIKENQTLPSLREKFLRNGLLHKGLEKQSVMGLVDKLNIKPKDINKMTRYLSGGNQQKVIIGRGMLKGAKTFVFDEVTRGVDIGSKIDFYKLISEVAKGSDGIIYISSEMTELLDLCNRIIIMYNKRMVATINHENAEREKLLHLILGMEKEE